MGALKTYEGTRFFLGFRRLPFQPSRECKIFHDAWTEIMLVSTLLTQKFLSIEGNT